MIIDFDRIAKAEKYYRECGYEKISVPWIVGQEAYSATKPSQAGRDFATLGGNLVASGEQGFLQLLLDGKKINKAQTTTPCFRDEKYDNLHHPYFMKTELINTNGGLENMIDNAFLFFGQFLPVKTMVMGKNMIDIVDRRSEIELGSYGIRTYKDFKWVYGTGLAEPRLTQVLEMNGWW